MPYFPSFTHALLKHCLSIPGMSNLVLIWAKFHVNPKLFTQNLAPNSFRPKNQVFSEKNIFTPNLALICRFFSKIYFRRLAQLVFVNLLRPKKLGIGGGLHRNLKWAADWISLAYTLNLPLFLIFFYQIFKSFFKSTFCRPSIFFLTISNG